MSVNYSQISFTDVAPRYNEINALPPAAAGSIGRTFIDLLGQGARVLDMGCGAGRIALPMAAAGLVVTGVDSDAAMLAEASRNAAAAGLDLEAIHGDITAMPLPDDHFNAVLSINVLHLVPAWQQALAEAMRVMRPSGLFIQGRDWLDPDSCAGRMRTRMREIVLTLEPGLRPTAAASPMVMAQALAQAGGSNEPDITAATWHTALSPQELLEQMAARAHNETWMLNDALLAATLERLGAWAQETWEDISRPEQVERRFVLTVTRGLRG